MPHDAQRTTDRTTFEEQLRDREPAAMQEFFDLYFERVFAYVRRVVHDEHLAEDLTQDVFMSIHRSLDRYDAERGLEPWVFTIARNKVRDYWRSGRYRHGGLEQSLDVEPVTTAGSDRVAQPSERLERAELDRDVHEAINELSEPNRETVRLRLFEGLSFDAISRMLGSNEIAVRKRYSRALQSLKSILAPRVAAAG